MIEDVKLTSSESFNVQLKPFRETNTVIDPDIKDDDEVTVNGLSAYEIAVKHGFIGTETDWLASLKGEQGPVGPKGADGYSPVRGTDYWTDEDKAEIKGYVDEAILGGAW